MERFCTHKSLEMANEKEYVIVDFPEESENGIISMALISSTWLFENSGVAYCYWPTYLKSTLSREKAVRNHSPIILDKCTQCPVIIKKHTSDYDKALRALKSLEEESEHSSQSSHTDEDETLDETLKATTTYRKPKKNTDFLYYDLQNNISDEEEIPIPPKLSLKSTKEKSYTFLGACSVNNEGPPQVNMNMNVEPTPLLNHVEQNNKSEKILERLLRDVQIIKADVKNVMMMVNNTQITQYDTLDQQLSFITYEQLLKFNNQLEEQDYFNKMLSSISLLGGRNLQVTISKMLSMLLKHELSLQLNWVGANEKGSFQKLDKVLKLIYAAVRKNPACANATNSEIEVCLKNWIRNASDREGGRANRQKKKESITPN